MKSSLAVALIIQNLLGEAPKQEPIGRRLTSSASLIHPIEHNPIVRTRWGYRYHETDPFHGDGERYRRRAGSGHDVV
jgi:hypothetical protein